MDDADFGDEIDQEHDPLDELDPNNPENAFAILERDYNKIYSELEDDPNLSQYAEEFAKIFDFLYKTREKALELETINTGLDESLKQRTDQFDNSLKVMKGDAQTIEMLKTELENSHKLIDNAHSREQAAQEIIDNLRKQIASLNAEIDFKTKMAQGELEENPEVTKHREGLEREKNKLISEVSKLTEKLNNALAYQEELERRTSLADVTMNEINTQLEETAAEVERFKRNKDKLESDLEDQKDEIIKKDNEIEVLKDSITSNQRVITNFENQLKEQTSAALKCFKDLENWNSKYTKLQNELDAINFSGETAKKDLHKMVQELKVRDEERGKLYIDITKINKARELAENKIKHLEEEKYEVIEQRNKLRDVLNAIRHDLEAQKKQVDADKREIENIHREKDIINKNFLRQQAVNRDHAKLIKIQENSKRKLELEIDSHIIEGRKHKKQISYLEKERDRLLEEELELTRKIEDTIDELKLSKNTVHDLKKTLADNLNKFRMQQNLFDAVRADRNALQKSLQESTAENHELKNKLKTTNHQTEQLKEDITNKEHLLIKEENILRKVVKEKEVMKVELNNSYDQIRSLKEDIAKLKFEEKGLHKVIATSDRTMREQAKSLAILQNDRDILGSQLVRRNDEIALLYEKVTILQSTLERGEAQYQQRLDDMRLLKVEIKRLRQEKVLLTKSINNINDLKQEIFHLERDLTRERLKTKALEDELQNPMNIHRWRKLEGSDPEVFELLQKTLLLQKRLLVQASQAIERERQLKETEKLYMNLRQVVAKQPGPEIQASLNRTKKALLNNVNKMKCLVSVLNISESQVQEYKVSVDKLTEELKEAKKQLLLEKKQRLKDKENLKALNSKVANQEAQQAKFFGGGFRMSVSGGANN